MSEDSPAEFNSTRIGVATNGIGVASGKYAIHNPYPCILLSWAYGVQAGSPVGGNPGPLPKYDSAFTVAAHRSSWDAYRGHAWCVVGAPDDELPEDERKRHMDGLWRYVFHLRMLDMGDCDLATAADAWWDLCGWTFAHHEHAGVLGELRDRVESMAEPGRRGIYAAAWRCCDPFCPPTERTYRKSPRTGRLFQVVRDLQQTTTEDVKGDDGCTVKAFSLAQSQAAIVSGQWSRQKKGGLPEPNGSTAARTNIKTLIDDGFLKIVKRGRKRGGGKKGEPNWYRFTPNGKPRRRNPPKKAG